MLILTGGMQGIPRELYEAAEVDGASWCKKELRITLPLLRRSIALSLIISVIGSLLAFNQFFILAQNNVSLETVVEWVYQTGVQRVPPRLRDGDGALPGRDHRDRQHDPVPRAAGHDRAVTAGGLTATRSAPARRRSSRGPGFYLYLATGLMLSVLFVLPLLWAIARSFQPTNLASTHPKAADFTHFTLANYRAVFGQEHILHNVMNSLVAAIGTALLTTIVSAMAGFGLAKFRFRGSGLVFSALLLALMIPFQAVLTPLFIELNYLHLTNSLVGLILIYSTFSLPFGVFVMRNTFQQVPRELMESAEVDGAGLVATLVRVLRPLIVPGLATTAIYAFLYSWTEFLQALTFLETDGKLTLPVKLFNIETSTYGAINYGYMSSGIVIAMVPCLVLYLSLQRYYVQGLMSGAVKG